MNFIILTRGYVPGPIDQSDLNEVSYLLLALLAHVSCAIDVALVVVICRSLLEIDIVVLVGEPSFGLKSRIRPPVSIMECRNRSCDAEDSRVERCTGWSPFDLAF